MNCDTDEVKILALCFHTTLESEIKRQNTFLSILRQYEGGRVKALSFHRKRCGRIHQAYLEKVWHHLCLWSFHKLQISIIDELSALQAGPQLQAASLLRE